MSEPESTADKFKLKSNPQTRRPGLRCPACGSEVELPANFCPHCKANLRTGMRPPKRFTIPHLPPLGTVLKIGVVLLACILLWSQTLMEKHSYKEATLGQTIKNLAQEHPIIMKPYLIANDVVENIQAVNLTLSIRHSYIEKWLHSLDGTSTTEDIRPLRNLTPAQRYETLQDLDRIISGHPSSARSDLVYLQKMTPAQRNLLLKRMNEDI